MTSTLFQGHRCVRNINCKMCVLDSCPLCSLNVVWLIHSLKKDSAQYDSCDSDVSSREISIMCFVGQVSWLVENLNIEIYSDKYKRTIPLSAYVHLPEMFACVNNPRVQSICLRTKLMIMYTTCGVISVFMRVLSVCHTIILSLGVTYCYTWVNALAFF